jgi:hypothetical protein
MEECLYTRGYTGAAAWVASATPLPMWDLEGFSIVPGPFHVTVFVLTSDEFHDQYTVAALQHGKHVSVEKPMTLSIPSAERIVDAERAAYGPRVFVGYMRRYAPSFVNAFKREMAKKSHRQSKHIAAFLVIWDHTTCR